MEKTQALLVPGGHHHVVFTLPGVLRQLWMCNRRRMTDALFAASTSVVRELLADPKYMGGQVGILAVFHSYAQDLAVHPHIHMLVPSRGLSPEGKVVKARWKKLLPFKVVRVKFAKALVCILRRLASEGALYLPRDHSFAWLHETLSRLYDEASRFNVGLFVREDPTRVVKYLSHSVYGGPVSDKRLVRADEHQVVLRKVEWKFVGQEVHRRGGTVALSTEEFGRRWVEHVADPGFKRVRRYGLYAAPCKAKLAVLRELLGAEPSRPARASEGGALPPAPLPTCSQCGGPSYHVHLAPTSLAQATVHPQPPAALIRGSPSHPRAA